MEKLKEELRVAFQMYLEARGKPGGRDIFWDAYVEKREAYIKACCVRDHVRYTPLRETLRPFDLN